jgi:nitrate/nitrite transporter NarK
MTGGMLLLVYTLVEAPQAGWFSARTLGSFLAVAAILTAFVIRERRTPTPLVRLGILRSGSLVRANLGAMSLFGGWVGFQFIATLYMQTLLGWSALGMAFAFLPAGLIVAFGAPRIGALADRFGTERIIVVGGIAFVIGYALFLRIDEGSAYAAVMLPTMLLLGTGFALTFPSLNIQATAGIANEEQGLASGLVSTSFQVGGAVVLAVVSAIVTSQTGSATDASSLLDGYRPAIAVVTLVAALGLLVGLTGILSRGRVLAMAE